jgi:hypothetical protein
MTADFTKVEMNTGHRDTETLRGERGEGKVYLSVISPSLPLFLSVSVPLWLVFAEEG